MSEGTVVGVESIRLTTSDGHGLAADLAAPTAGDRGGVVVCHPHPQFGGDRFNPIVDAVFRHLPSLGFATLRFDFRSAFGGGVDERLDVIAGLDALDSRTNGPLAVVGYSFGAAVALGTVDERITAVVAIAPPLAMSRVAPPPVPVLVLTPQHDQFTPPDAAATATAGWADVELRTVDSVDHFLVGQAARVAASAGEWLVDRQ